MPRYGVHLKVYLKDETNESEHIDKPVYAVGASDEKDASRKAKSKLSYENKFTVQKVEEVKIDQYRA